jgi:hypothetical protein
VEHRDLKDLYQGIDIEDQELAGYRQRLESRLAQEARAASQPRSSLATLWRVNVARWPGMFRYAPAAMVVVAISLVLLRQLQPAGFDSLELGDCRVELA